MIKFKNMRRKKNERKHLVQNKKIKLRPCGLIENNVKTENLKLV